MPIVTEEYNCRITTPDWGWCLVDPSGFGDVALYNVPWADPNNDEEVSLEYIDVFCSRFINPNTTITTSNGIMARAGQVTSTGNMVLTCKINGIHANESYTVKDQKRIMTPPGTHDNYHCNARLPEDSAYLYRFTFPQKVILKGGSKANPFCLIVTGMRGGNTDGLSFKSTDGNFGYAKVKKVTNYPDDIKPDPDFIPSGGLWITNLSGKPQGGDILADSVESFKIIATPSTDIEIVNPEFTGNSNENCSLVGLNVNVTAKNSTADYPTKDNVTLSIDGNNGRISTTFSVSFYKKPKIAFSKKDVVVNIKRPQNVGFKLSTYDIGNLANGETFSALRYMLPNNTTPTEWDLNSKHVPDSSLFISASKYVGVESNIANFFKIANEGKIHKLTYRYFNPKVQKVSVDNNYNSDNSCTFIFYAKPSEIEQFSFDWLTDSGKKTNEPPVIMSGFIGSPAPGNLKYTNSSITGGYCRAIKLSFYKENGSKLYEEVRYTTDQNDESSLLSGRIITKNDVLWKKLRELLGGSYITERLTVRADLAFCFNDDKNTLYYGCYYVWESKLWLVTEEDFACQLIFPIVSEKAPATPMMLEDVERFGFHFAPIVSLARDNINIAFSLTIGGVVLEQKSRPEYFSSSKIVENLVVDVGKFVKDNKIYLEQCEVIPKLTIFTGEEHEITINYGTDRWIKPNSVINTLESTMWYRPVAEKGEYATYFDVNKFQQFIDKYYLLNDGQLKFSPIVKEKRGDIINTDFWKQIEERLNTYTKNMQGWATEVTNMIVIWAFPEFKHEKGEYITNNNLYQNYWDLLHMFSGYESFATHDYIKDSGYSHDDLSVHSHDDITNKRGI